ncbi:MAG: hypothetical protein ACRDDY_04745 [Clostridium sp.]|uniref:hypothetical protein n=1 Tax=Clostridium sp. TaxID=1506 RepID=UPI003EE518DA
MKVNDNNTSELIIHNKTRLFGVCRYEFIIDTNTGTYKSIETYDDNSSLVEMIVKKMVNGVETDISHDDAMLTYMYNSLSNNYMIVDNNKIIYKGW